MFDLIVIGAGPAGSSAAITAAQQGAKVLLLERGRFPRHRVCGEFCSSESLGLLATLLDSGHAEWLQNAPRMRQARIFVDGHELSAPVSPAAASIARFDLDLALWESARANRIEAKDSVTVKAINGEGPFRVFTSDGSFESRALINASGRWSNLTMSPGLALGAEKWIGIKGHFAEEDRPDTVDLYFFAGGYCGVSPVDLRDDAHKGKRVNACAMVRSDVAVSLPAVFQQHPTLLHRSSEWMPISAPVTTAPLIFRKPQAVRHGILMAGDAAGFVDPFVGDGISLALRAGALAGKSIAPFLRGSISYPDVLQEYETAFTKTLGPIFSASSRIRRMFAMPKPLRRLALGILERTPSMTRHMVHQTR